MEFFRTLAQRVAENLLHHVDGRLAEKRTTVVKYERNSSDYIPNNVAKLNLAEYNFPPDFSIESWSPSSEAKVDFLLECNLKESNCNNSSDGSSERTLNPLLVAGVFKDSAKNNDSSSYLCCVCGDSFTTMHEFDDHEMNNHPNVVCSFVEVDFVRNVPMQLLWQYNSPYGVLRRCVVPSFSASSATSLSSQPNRALNFKCTKCNKTFNVVAQLHQHIIDCASSASETTPKHEQTDEIMRINCENKSIQCVYNTRASGKRNIDLVMTKESNKRSRLICSNQKCDVAVQTSPGSQKTNSSAENIAKKVKENVELNYNKESEAPKRYTCSKCSKKFMFLVTLQKHQLTCKIFYRRSKPKQFDRTIRKVICSKSKSDTCSKKFKAIANGKSFKQKVANIKNGKNFNSYIASDNLSSSNNEEVNVIKSKASHKSLASGLQEHRCPRCSRGFTYLANFKKHVKKSCRHKIAKDSEAFDIKIKEETENNSQNEPSEIFKGNQEFLTCGKVNDANSSDDNDATETEEGDYNVNESNEEQEESGKNNLTAERKDNSKLDLFRVKQEHPLYAFKGSPAQHHSCPYCQRGFTYLANYRKHVNGICPIRQQIDNTKRKVLEESEPLVVKLESDQLNIQPNNHSNNNDLPASNILKDQTKQNEIIQISLDENKLNSNHNSSDSKCSLEVSATEVKENNSNTLNEDIESQKFRSFECTICHKIYLSHVKMMRHMLSHKLEEGASKISEVVADLLDEKEIAKQALQKQATIEHEKRRKLNTNNSSAFKTRNSKQQGDVPCANLLEKLARGGENENADNNHRVDDKKAKHLLSTLPQASLLLLPSSQPLEDGDENNVMLQNENNNYAIVIQEDADLNDLSNLEAITPEMLDNLKGEFAHLVVNREENANTVGDVMMNIGEENAENGDVWIAFTANENEAEEQQQSAFLLPRSMTL
ncbi:hypothetical protein B4U79_16252 [Dinothrombium tinctorium]|uniref:C2H2-type domain-containing protein n=1 Tax=Dinothrombium tinctorium TaxID=1965070 RepID=A0A443QSP5_9ACAR|nr:hypothetical protein B4U79_16252 [Dinothrombium tinctorium]